MSALPHVEGTSYRIDLHDEGGVFLARHRGAFADDREAMAYARRIGGAYVTLVWQDRRLVAYIPPPKAGPQRARRA